MNDAACDRRGASGSDRRPRPRRSPRGKLYRVDADLACRGGARRDRRLERDRLEPGRLADVLHRLADPSRRRARLRHRDGCRDEPARAAHAGGRRRRHPGRHVRRRAGQPLGRALGRLVRARPDPGGRAAHAARAARRTRSPRSPSAVTTCERCTSPRPRSGSTPRRSRTSRTRAASSRPTSALPDCPARRSPVDLSIFPILIRLRGERSQGPHAPTNQEWAHGPSRHPRRDPLARSRRRARVLRRAVRLDLQRRRVPRLQLRADRRRGCAADGDRAGAGRRADRALLRRGRRRRGDPRRGRTAGRPHAAAGAAGSGRQLRRVPGSAGPDHRGRGELIYGAVEGGSLGPPSTAPVAYDAVMPDAPSTDRSALLESRFACSGERERGAGFRERSNGSACCWGSGPCAPRAGCTPSASEPALRSF